MPTSKSLFYEYTTRKINMGYLHEILRKKMFCSCVKKVTKLPRFDGSVLVLNSGVVHAFRSVDVLNSGASIYKLEWLF